MGRQAEARSKSESLGHRMSQQMRQEIQGQARVKAMWTKAFICYEPTTAIFACQTDTRSYQTLPGPPCEICGPDLNM